MSEETKACQLTVLVPLYVLGTIEHESREGFERHLEAGCDTCAVEVARCEEDLSLLSLEVEPGGVSGELRARILSDLPGRQPRGAEDLGVQIWKSWDSEHTEDLILPQDDQGFSETAIAGIWVRKLYVDVDRDAVTMLVRMEPGTAYPRHRHAGPETCFVIEGTIDVGETRLRKGDFQAMSTDSVHEVQSTEEGCLLLIQSSSHDELL